MQPSFELVNGHEWHDRLDPLYRLHYAEMKTRLDADGIPIGEYNPDLKSYFAAMDSGMMLTFIVQLGGTVIGYSNIWVTNDMHNGELIGSEDTVFILKEHRNGVGRKLVQHILKHLDQVGCKRVTITPVTDLRVGKIWARMGFKPVCELMMFTFGAK